jgi:hypothetical protein
MDLERIFGLLNLSVLPFWVLLIAVPRFPWALRLIGSPWIVAVPMLLYAAFVAPQLPSLLSSLANPSLGSIAQLLGAPSGALIGWAHFLAFDLFVGRWVYLDAHTRGVHPALIALPLVFTFMTGPLGLLLYLFVRRFAPQRSGASLPH